MPVTVNIAYGDASFTVDPLTVRPRSSSRTGYPASVDTFGTAVVPEEQIRDAVLAAFDLRPGAIVRDLDLLRPIYSDVTVYGHFGRELPNATWERTDRAEELAKAAEKENNWKKSVQ